MIPVLARQHRPHRPVVGTSPPPPPGGGPPVAGYALWLAADEITGLSDGDPVAAWADASGNGYDATQATSGKRPVYKTGVVNGLPVVRLDGSDDGLTSGHSAGVNVTVFAVYNTRTGAAFVRAIQGSTNWFMTPNFFANQWCWFAGDGQGYVDSGIASGGGGFVVHAVVQSGTGGTQYVNGVAAGTITAAAVAPGTISVGNNAEAGGSSPSDVAELIVYPSALNGTDRASVESYLATKYGL